MNTTDIANVSSWIEAHQDEIVQTLAALVQIPSVIGNEAPAQAFMRQHYEQAKLEIDEFEPDYATLRQHPAFVDSEIAFAGRRNVIGTWRANVANAAGRSIVLNGHTDVVSAEPLSAWQHDPFAATIIPSNTSKLGRMIGRGAQDMKSGLIANLFAVKALQACGIELNGDVILQSVIEEESGGGGGTLACFERAKQQGKLPDGMIATEPHWLDVCIAHPGILYFRVVVEIGRAHV